jgi:hypothetical protein
MILYPNNGRWSVDLFPSSKLSDLICDEMHIWARDCPFSLGIFERKPRFKRSSIVESESNGRPSDLNDPVTSKELLSLQLIEPYKKLTKYTFNRVDL